jgi:phosphatidylethanolamine/phosphatidyl-N-methylethanolamine N-methyltransferase
VVERGLMERVYDNLSVVYDVAFGPLMQHGRQRAVAAMGDTRGRSVLEVGVGTGLNLLLYQPGTDVTGVDVSSQMLDRAATRAARAGLTSRLFQMDASDLRFPEGTFDIVYAPYVISVVPDPVRVLREMLRVCRPVGKVLILNHFRSTKPWLSRMERWISPFTVHIGFKADVDMAGLFARVDLVPDWTEKVNRPAIWMLVHCTRQSPSVELPVRG